MSTSARPRLPSAPSARAASGCFPIVAWERDNTLTWGVEAIMLSAGAALSWLVDDVEIAVQPSRVGGGGRSLL